MALEGWECSELSGPATLPCAPISASTCAPACCAASADMTTTAAAPSEICDAVPAVIVPSGAERGLELGQRLDGGAGADALVLGHGQLLALVLHRYRDDLGGEQAVLGRGRGALVGGGRELVLLLRG